MKPTKLQNGAQILQIKPRDSDSWFVLANTDRTFGLCEVRSRFERDGLRKCQVKHPYNDSSHAFFSEVAEIELQPMSETVTSERKPA